MKTALLICLFGLWLLSPVLGCYFGALDLTYARISSDLAAIFSASGPASPGLAVVELRLARGILALLAGGALATSGAALQGALRNPLADPFTLGISAGAACGASIAIALLPAQLPLAYGSVIALAALFGAFGALLASLLLGRGHGGADRESVVLGGIAVAAFLGSIVALIKALNEESVTSIVFWIMGSLQGRGWHDLPLLLMTLLPGLAVVALSWRKLDVLSMGDEQAAYLGLEPARARLWILAGASCMTAGCVAVCGVIGFVGLVAPHILRLLLGPAHGRLLFASFLGGGLFLLIADCFARSVLPDGQELPAGVVTALAGAPFFAFLLRKRP